MTLGTAWLDCWVLVELSSTEWCSFGIFKIPETQSQKHENSNSSPALVIVHSSIQICSKSFWNKILETPLALQCRRLDPNLFPQKSFWQPTYLLWEKKIQTMNIRSPCITPAVQKGIIWASSADRVGLTDLRLDGGRWVMEGGGWWREGVGLTGCRPDCDTYCRWQRSGGQTGRSVVMKGKRTALFRPQSLPDRTAMA